MSRSNTKDKIIKTAYELFRIYGYKSVSVIDICEACQITKPTFYKYIESKHTLLKYYFTNMTANLVVKKEKEELSYYDLIIEAFSGYYGPIEEMGLDLYRHVIISNLQKSMGTYDDDDQFNSTIEQLIRSGQEKGEFGNKADAIFLTNAILSLSLGSAVNWYLNKTSDKSIFTIFQDELGTLLEVNKQES